MDAGEILVHELDGDGRLVIGFRLTNSVGQPRERRDRRRRGDSASQRQSRGDPGTELRYALHEWQFQLLPWDVRLILEEIPGVVASERLRFV